MKNIELVKRKPDGGLAKWIEILEAGDNQSDAVLLCLLLELRRFREDKPALIEQLKAVQSERDECHQRLANAEYQLEMAELAKFNLRGQRKAQFRKRRAAEAELKRRDDAAGDPRSWMTQVQMQSDANIYRHDNEEDTNAWFDAKTALWTEGYLSPSVFHHIFKPDEAGGWLDDEIALIEEEGLSAQSYREIRNGETANPVVVVFDNGRAVVWDGFHRIAAAVARKEPVYAIFSYAAAAAAVHENALLPDHKFRECVNGLLEEAIAYAGTQQLRARLSSRLSNFVKPQRAAGVKWVEGE